MFPDDPILRREVLALLEAGHSVDVICLREGGQLTHEDYEGAQIYRIPVSHRRGAVGRYVLEYGFSFLLMTLLLAVFHARKRYDLVHVNAMPDFLVFTAFLPRLFGAKIVLHLYEPTPELFITKFGERRFRALYRLQVRFEQSAIRFADWCFAVSKAIRARYGERGANIDRITVLPNCSVEYFDRHQPKRPTEHDDEFRLITHGLVEHRYGHETVVRAIALLANELPDLRYDITGSGEYEPKVRELVKQLGLEDRIRFSGYLETPQLLSMLDEADVGVITMHRSPYSELIDTIKMYEYIALKKPVIASRLRTITDNFDDSCIRLIEPGDATALAACIRELHDDPALRERLANEAHRRYQSLKWSLMKHVYLAVVENVVANGRDTSVDLAAITADGSASSSPGPV